MFLEVGPFKLAQVQPPSGGGLADSWAPHPRGLEMVCYESTFELGTADFEAVKKLLTEPGTVVSVPGTKGPLWIASSCCCKLDRERPVLTFGAWLTWDESLVQKKEPTK